MNPAGSPEAIITAYRPDGLVVDFDGSLADSTDLHENALRLALADHGITLDSRWYRANVGLGIHELISVLPGVAAGVLPVAAIVESSRSWLLANLNRLAPIPATVNLVRHARAVLLPCAVATSASHHLVDPALHALGLAELFQSVVAAEDVEQGKPSPEAFLTAAGRLGCPPERCLAIEDSEAGTVAARAAGMTVLTVLEGLLYVSGGAE